MTLVQVLGLVGFSLLLASGQILFKAVALASSHATGWRALALVALLPRLWLALALYGLATLLWIYLLRTVPLSRAYPFAALGFVIVPAAGVLLFGEQVTMRYVAGAALVVAGILVIARA